ncbi:hypothetical protein GF385_01140 [Candidatus Dependentiae bacterium]|nr:hypothetical protein [Candidatus Dependentiae bacterium]
MKKFFKNKVAAILLTSTLLSSNIYAWEWKKIGQGVSNAWNSTQRFFNADTNTILNDNRIGTIKTAEKTLKNLDNKITILQESQESINNLIYNTANNTKDIIDWSEKINQLKEINKCIAQQEMDTVKLINFIESQKKPISETEIIKPKCVTKTYFIKKGNKIIKPKTIFERIKNVFGLKTEDKILKPELFAAQNERICTDGYKAIKLKGYEYPIHNSITEEGIKSSNLDYAKELTERQIKIYKNTKQCLKKTGAIDTYKERINRSLSEEKEAYKQYKYVSLEKFKYLIRELLKTITPDNPYLKCALITALTISSIEAAYALTYGIVNRDLRKGIKNVAVFNWNVLKFLPYTMPKWTLKNIIRPTLLKILGGYQRGANFVQGVFQLNEPNN